MRINTQQLTALIGRIGLTRFTQVVLITGTALAICLLSVWTSQQALTDNAPRGGITPRLPESQSSLLDIKLLTSARIFGKPTRKPGPVAAQPKPRTLTNWQLQGVFTSNSPSRGSAIITSLGQPAALYQTQQTLPGGAKLLEVHTNHVVLEQLGKKRILMFPPISQASTRIGKAPSIAGRISAPKEATDERQKLVRQRLEKLRQKALSRS